MLLLLEINQYFPGLHDTNNVQINLLNELTHQYEQYIQSFDRRVWGKKNRRRLFRNRAGIYYYMGSSWAVPIKIDLFS